MCSLNKTVFHVEHGVTKTYMEKIQTIQIKSPHEDYPCEECGCPATLKIYDSGPNYSLLCNNCWGIISDEMREIGRLTQISNIYET